MPDEKVLLLVGGIQLAEADVVGDGAAEEVRVLQHDAQAAAQGLLRDVPHVDAVVGDDAAAHLVEAVDQVGDGGLSGSRGPHEGDLLPRFGKEREPLEDGLPLHIAKVNVIEAHVAGKGHVLAVNAPRPA